MLLRSHYDKVLSFEKALKPRMRALYVVCISDQNKATKPSIKERFSRRVNPDAQTDVGTWRNGRSLKPTREFSLEMFIMSCFVGHDDRISHLLVGKWKSMRQNVADPLHRITFFQENNASFNTRILLNKSVYSTRGSLYGAPLTTCLSRENSSDESFWRLKSLSLGCQGVLPYRNNEAF